MGFKSPNYTQAPNEFFDEWLPKLNLVELRVLMIITRKTFGWRKSRDRISLSQLEKFTGSSRTNILKSVKNLIQLNLITKQVEGINGNEKTFYELVVEDEELNKNYQCSKITPPVISNHPPSDFESPTKETNTKETNTKKENTLTSIKESPADFLVSFGKFVKMTQVSYDELGLKYGKETIQEYIDRINDHIASKGLKPYKDYPATIRNWIRRSKADLKISPTPYSESPPLNASVEKNLKFVQDCKKEYPSEFKDIRIFGKSHVTSDRKESKVSGHDYARFDMNPQEFENILFKMAGVRRAE